MRNYIKALPGLALLLLFSNFSALYAQTNITVNASSAVGTVPSEIYGNNMAPWVGTNNGSDSAYNTAMQVSGSQEHPVAGRVLGRYPELEQHHVPGSYDVTTPQYIAFLQQFGGQMHAICNFSGDWCGLTQYTHAQAVSLAAAWVTWNMTNAGSARAKYFDIGNEDYGTWEQGGGISGTTYGTNFVDYYKGMKAIDTTILIGAVANPRRDGLQKLDARGVDGLQKRRCHSRLSHHPPVPGGLRHGDRRRRQFPGQSQLAGQFQNQPG